MKGIINTYKVYLRVYRDVLKFWRKTSAKKAADFKKNKKLGQEFEETLRQKISFETLTSESNEVIKGLVSQK